MRPLPFPAAVALSVATSVVAAPTLAQTMPLPAKIAAPSGHYVLDPALSSVLWRVQHFGLERFTAKFARVASTVDYDAGDPTRSKLDVTIDAASVRTDFPFADKKDFDAEIRGFLGAAANPKIHFVSREITRTGPNSGVILGDLTLNGVTKPITLKAVWDGAILNPKLKAPVFGISATGTIKRSDFGVTAYLPAVSDDTELRIEAEYDKN